MVRRKGGELGEEKGAHDLIYIVLLIYNTVTCPLFPLLHVRVSSPVSLGHTWGFTKHAQMAIGSRKVAQAYARYTLTNNRLVQLSIA